MCHYLMFNWNFNVIMNAKWIPNVAHGNGWNHKVYHSWVVKFFCEINHILL
jgi:hypothetical protein